MSQRPQMAYPCDRCVKTFPEDCGITDACVLLAQWRLSHERRASELRKDQDDRRSQAPERPRRDVPLVGPGRA